jgi:hypothetical protein
LLFKHKDGPLLHATKNKCVSLHTEFI